MAKDEQTGWIVEMLMASTSVAPAALLEEVMADERCVDLADLMSRSDCVPGATCARWGMCGAAASAGMAYAIVRGNAPLRSEGWQEGQLMVSELLAAIARSGSPRCCKRDARVAIREAVSFFNSLGGPQLKAWEKTPACDSYAANTVCMGEKCPYHPSFIIQ